MAAQSSSNDIPDWFAGFDLKDEIERTRREIMFALLGQFWEFFGVSIHTPETPSHKYVFWPWSFQYFIEHDDPTCIIGSDSQFYKNMRENPFIDKVDNMLTESRLRDASADVSLEEQKDELDKSIRVILYFVKAKNEEHGKLLKREQTETLDEAHNKSDDNVQGKQKES
ncbi:MAG: hypothetical protein Q9168_002932 [Polycauliona sp. 1 TL-2023]